MTNITYERMQYLQRLVIGDYTAASGDLGSSVSMGGLSLSRVYGMDPYFIKYPLANFEGFTSLPSTVEVYLNGMRLRTEKLSPGEFGLNNISYYGGANSVEVVIRDAFGRVQTVRYPFYSTDVLLKAGLHEYSYNIGSIRNNLGTESNNYHGLAFSGFHKYGAGDSLTVGINSEGGRGNYNLGAQATFLLKQTGIATLALSGSRDAGDRAGLAGTLNYSYQDKKINAHMSFRGFTKDYATINSGLITDKTKYEAGAAIGYGTKDFGSASVTFGKIGKYVGQDSQSIIANYTRNISSKISLFASFTRRKEAETSNAFFVGLTYYPREGMTLSSSYEKSNGTSSETLQLQKSTPAGEGLGYRASINRVDTPSGETTTANPFLQYNSRFGTYTAEYSRQFTDTGGTENYNLSAAGGIAYVGNTIGFSRIINDSFGLAKVGSLQGVRVYQSNQEIGRTDSSGRVFIPNLSSYYDNQVSIGDKDIPIDYSIKEVVRYISPPLRSGAIINFEVTKFQAITGMLKIRTDKEVLPAEFYEINMMVDKKGMTFPTGKGGEFYLENVKPGKYSAFFDYNGKKCFFDIIIPVTDDMLIDLGGLICEDIR
jgi:outer membrane usher protein FimD/PapC